MNYDHEILAVLTRAGEKGLKLQYIARHVYNACNSMFTPLDYKAQAILGTVLLVVYLCFCYFTGIFKKN